MTPQERFASRKWGVFNHYLWQLQGNPANPQNNGLGEMPWSDMVERFDAERLAWNLHKMQAGYYFITLMQGRNKLLAPNATYDRIAGTVAGEACARRDLPMDLARALAKYDIALCLYFTGDGPWIDEEQGKRFGFIAPRKNISMDFVEKWSSVLQEYAQRYGDLVKAWWIDGCYRDDFGYTEDMYALYRNAILQGNPDALMAYNDGIKYDYQKNYSLETLTAGEYNNFHLLPDRPYYDGALAHTLAPIGYVPGGNRWNGWCATGLRHPVPYMTDFIRAFNQIGGVVTVDMFVTADGSFDPEQEAAMRQVGNLLGGITI